MALTVEIRDAEQRKIATWSEKSRSAPVFKGTADEDFLDDIHVELEDRIFRRKNRGRAWMLALALELRTPYLSLKYFEDGKELSKQEVTAMVRKLV